MPIELRQVCLVARRRQPVVDDLREVFGLEVAHVDPGVASFGLENAVLPVASQFLEVVAPIREGTAAGRYLDRRGGDGGYLVICQSDDVAAVRERAAAEGVRIAFEFEVPDEYRCTQFHPADTGGSFLEVDWSCGDPAGDGPWWPAGSEWRRAVRTHRVSAITAVELQSNDPRRVAERWSRLLGIPLEDGDALVLRVANAELRFAPATDGRGDGLEDVELQAVDAAAVLAAAAARGLAVEDGEVLLGGVRFRLL